MRTYATDRQLLLALLVGIASHPLIKDPPIYYPIQKKNKSPEQVKISKFRAYAGRELLESKLTLSVFYRYKPSNKSGLEFAPYTLGNTEPGVSLDKGLVRIVVQLSLQDTLFDQPYTLNYEEGYQHSETDAHGRQINVKADNQNLIYSEVLDNFVSSNQLTVYVSPAEEVLRDYISLMRAVLRDQHVFNPYIQRNLSIKGVEYLTPEIFEDAPENLVFHKSQIHIELDVYEPPTARSLVFLPPIEDINIVDNPE